MILTSQLAINFLPSAASTGTFCCLVSGRSVAWLARLFRVQEVVSSNLTAPTIFPCQGWETRFCTQIQAISSAFLAWRTLCKQLPLPRTCGKILVDGYCRDT